MEKVYWLRFKGSLKGFADIEASYGKSRQGSWQDLQLFVALNLVLLILGGLIKVGFEQHGLCLLVIVSPMKISNNDNALRIFDPLIAQP